MSRPSKPGSRDQAWARAEIWSRLEAQLDNTMEGIAEDAYQHRTFNEPDMRRLEKAVKQVRKTLARLSGRARTGHGPDREGR